MTDNDNDQFSKLLADSQADFERDVMSLKGSVKAIPQEPLTSLVISSPVSLPSARLMSREGNNKRVWSSHPRSGMR